MLNANLDIDSKSIEELYEWYANEVLIVNRRYQRKLVWSIDEKKALISSILASYPIPLLLFVRMSDSKEILDGMQRLEAVMSFIEQRFDFDGEYFDLDSTALTKQLRDSGVLIQKEPVMNRGKSTLLARYKFAVSEYSSGNDDIDEVFRRINSNGKTLSKQELRSAGRLSNFSELVRRISTTIRGDTSHSDTLNLNAMSTISIGSDSLDYGVNINTHFFVTNGILTRLNIRESHDEELIANILGYIALERKPTSGSSALNDFYGITDTPHAIDQRERLEAYIQTKGESEIINSFIYVYEQIKELFELHGINFKKHILGVNSTSQAAPRYYQAVFLALYDLMINQNLVINDSEALLNKFDNIGSTAIEVTDGGRWAAASRQKSVEDVAALISRYFKPNPQDAENTAWVSEINQILVSSRTEQANYDFKQGFTQLHGEPKFNDDLLKQVISTCIGINNIGKDSNGFVVIGIADNEACAMRIKEFYDVDSIGNNGFYITGIDHEAMNLYGSLDLYFSAIKQKIQGLNFNEPLKQQLLKDVRVCNYRGKHLIRFKVKSVGQPCFLDERMYLRQGTSTDEVKDTAAMIHLITNYTSGI